jgi:flagellum-specific ATP synthase
MNEPVADTMRSILDGHLVLRRELAAKNQYPAIDILSSISRLMTDLAAPEHLNAAAIFKELMSTYQHNEDMINIGAYQKGTSPEIDRAIAYHPRLVDFIKQSFEEAVTLESSIQALIAVTRGQEGPQDAQRR